MVVSLLQCSGVLRSHHPLADSVEAGDRELVGAQRASVVLQVEHTLSVLRLLHVDPPQCALLADRSTGRLPRGAATSIRDLDLPCGDACGVLGPVIAISMSVRRRVRRAYRPRRSRLNGGADVDEPLDRQKTRSGVDHVDATSQESAVARSCVGDVPAKRTQPIVIGAAGEEHARRRASCGS